MRPQKACTIAFDKPVKLLHELYQLARKQKKTGSPHNMPTMCHSLVCLVYIC